MVESASRTGTLLREIGAKPGEVRGHIFLEAKVAPCVLHTQSKSQGAGQVGKPKTS